MKGHIQFLVFRLDECLYAIRLSHAQCVVHSVEFTPLPQSPEIVLGVIDLHGEIVPVLNLRKRFGFVEREVGVDDHFIVARVSGRTIALVVDIVIGVVERPAEEIIAAENIIPHLRHVEGVIQLEDGLVVIHDLGRFLSLEEDRKLEQALVGKPDHGT